MKITRTIEPTTPTPTADTDKAPVQKPVPAAKGTIRDWQKAYHLGLSEVKHTRRPRTLNRHRPTQAELNVGQRFVMEVPEKEFMKWCKAVRKAKHPIPSSALPILLSIPAKERLAFLRDAGAQGWDTKQMQVQKKDRFGSVERPGRPRHPVPDRATAKLLMVRDCETAIRALRHNRQGGDHGLLLDEESDRLVQAAIDAMEQVVKRFSDEKTPLPHLRAA